MKEKRDKEWVKEQKAREEAWGRRGRMRNTLKWIEEGRKEGEKDEREKAERDNTIETRFETHESFCPTQPELPPFPPSITESLEAEWVSDSGSGAKDEEKKEEKKKGKGRVGKSPGKSGKGSKGAKREALSYAQLKGENEDLRKMLEEEKGRNEKKKRGKEEKRRRREERSGHSSGSDVTVKARSTSSGETIKSYEEEEEEERPEPPSKFVARQKAKEVEMDAE